MGQNWGPYGFGGALWGGERVLGGLGLYGTGRGEKGFFGGGVLEEGFWGVIWAWGCSMGKNWGLYGFGGVLWGGERVLGVLEGGWGVLRGFGGVLWGGYVGLEGSYGAALGTP